MTNNDDLALKSRIEKALTDFTNGRACMHVPAQETDVDLVLADCLSLLAERDADKKRIAALEKKEVFLKERLAQLANFNPDWDMLEAATDSLREHAAELTSANQRIAGLEARTVSVKLPEPPGPMSVGARTVYCGIVADVVGAFQTGLAAAGINLEVGE